MDPRDLRKNIYSLSATELQDFIEAVNLLKANGTYDTFVRRHHHAMMHATPMPGENPDPNIRNVAHRGPAFLAWHRQELRDYELALQAVKPGVTLPYWDWAQDAQLPDPKTAPLWTNTYIGGDGAGPNDFVPNGPFTHWVALIENTAGDLVPRSTPGIVRRLGRDPQGYPTLPTQADVTNCLNEGVYDSAPWGMTSNPSFRNRLEGWLIRPGEPNESRMHNRVHTWIGGDMLPGTSPNDPVFFLHHCNVDRLWAQWQAEKGAPYAPLSGGPAGHNATDPMMYLENTDVTPGSVLDHHAMGYMYDTEGSSIMAWNLAGNANTNPNTNFLGTTDTQPLVVRTNGVERMRVIPDGNVGIGTTTPDKKLCVREATSSLRFSHEGGPAVLRVENSAAASLTALNLGNNARNWQLRVEGTDGNKFKVFDATAIADRLTIDTAGNLGIGTRNPQRTLDIAAARGSTEFVIRDDSQPLDQRAWRLMNNSQLLAIEAVNDALTGGTNVMNFTRDGLVGIGTKSPQYALHLKTGWGILGLDTQAVNQHSGIRLHENGAVKWHVWNDGSATGNRLNINSATGLGMQIAQDGTAGFGRDIRLENPNGATIYGRARLHVHGEELLYVLNKAGVVIGKEWGGNGDLRVQGNLSVQGIAGVGTWAPEKARLAVSETRRLPAVLGSSPQRGVHGIGGGEATVSLNTDVAGVYGTSTSGAGVFGVSSSLYPGVEGGGTGQSNIGVRAIAYSSSGYGLQAENTSGGYAGLFLGHVQIRGNIQATGTKAFLIDHPLDPANMYLQHFALESPDMLCVYNGNVTTDEQGTATVVLPAYLHTLNHEFRYQVTVLGQSAQAIVEREIEDNQFSIKTDKPNVKVSWQVTGVRRDPYAEANRTPVEVAKPDEERGRYLQPELYDADEASSIPSGLGIAPLLMDGEHQGT